MKEKETKNEYKLIPCNQEFGIEQRKKEAEEKLNQELEKELQRPNLPPYTEKRWWRNHY